ncbi:MAG: hypothetical protein HGA45_18930, partial [Chloroflexales bacterium]|nr:hypothetical protein [Chloroflexales bacterium]
MPLTSAGEGRGGPLRWLLSLLGAVALTTALLTLALLHAASYTVNVGEPGDAYGLASFHRPETVGADYFRWSAPGSSLLIPAAYDGPLALELRLHALATAEQATLRVERDGATVAVAATTPDWRVYRLLLPPDARPEAAPLRLETLGLASPPAFGPGDARPLGVALDALRVRPAPGEAPTLPALARAAAVAWGAGLAWAAVALLAGWRRPAAAAFPMLAAGAGLALWAWRAPLGFAWAVPTPPWWLLALLTGGLAAAGYREAIGARWSPRAIRPPRLWAVALATMGAGLLALLLPAPWSGAGALLVALTPGALVAWAIFPEERSVAARAFLGICGAVAVAALLALWLHAIPGPLPGWLLMGAACAVAAAALWARSRAEWPCPALAAASGQEAGVGDLRSAKLQTESAPYFGGAALVVFAALLVGAGLRLWRLGSAEFQGDEARAMLLALSVAQGDDGLLLTHTKGPVEVLLPAVALVASGTRAEWAARLPFALASLGVLAGALALMEAFARWDERGAGATPHRASLILPMALLAADGLAVAFGRIVQYQSVVMLMMAGALWCCWRFYVGAARAARHLTAAAVLLAVGLLAHYDAVMVAPALAWLVVAGARRRGWCAREWVLQMAGPALLGAALLASFYLPYVASASFGRTAEYLAGRAGQGDAGGPPFNNLPLYYSVLAFYSAPYLAPALVVAVAAS